MAKPKKLRGKTDVSVTKEMQQRIKNVVHHAGICFSANDRLKAALNLEPIKYSPSTCEVLNLELWLYTHWK